MPLDYCAYNEHKGVLTCAFASVAVSQRVLDRAEAGLYPLREVGPSRHVMEVPRADKPQHEVTQHRCFRFRLLVGRDALFVSRIPGDIHVSYD